MRHAAGFLVMVLGTMATGCSANSEGELSSVVEGLKEQRLREQSLREQEEEIRKSKRELEKAKQQLDEREAVLSKRLEQLERDKLTVEEQSDRNTKQSNEIQSRKKELVELIRRNSEISDEIRIRAEVARARLPYVEHLIDIVHASPFSDQQPRDYWRKAIMAEISSTDILLIKDNADFMTAAIDAVESFMKSRRPTRFLPKDITLKEFFARIRSNPTPLEWENQTQKEASERTREARRIIDQAKSLIKNEGDTDAARLLLLRAVKLDENIAEAHLGLGTLYFNEIKTRMSKPGWDPKKLYYVCWDCQTELEAAMRLDTESAVAHELLAAAYDLIAPHEREISKGWEQSRRVFSGSAQRAKQLRTKARLIRAKSQD